MEGIAFNDAERLLLEELQVLEREMESHYRWVFDTLAPDLGRSVLEVGSGAGVLSKFLVARGGPVVLTDYHEGYVAKLRERFGAVPNVHFARLDLTDPVSALPDCAVDTIVCLNVIEHIDDDGHAVRHLARQLPRGGRLLVQVPHYPALYGSLDQAYGHFRRYTRRGLEGLLETNGFEVRSLRNFNALGIPGWIWSARIARARRIDPRAMRLFSRLVPLARALDRLLPFVGLALLSCAVRR